MSFQSDLDNKLLILNVLIADNTPLFHQKPTHVIVTTQISFYKLKIILSYEYDRFISLYCIIMK